MKEVRKLAGQTVVYGLGTIIPRFLNYAVLTPFYTRIFTDPADYGVITEIYAWMVLLLVVLTYGMETGFFRFSQKSDDADRVYSTTLISVLITSLLFVAAVFIFIGPVSAVMNYRDNPDYIKMFAAIVAIDAFSAIPFARLRRENKPLIFSALKIANVIISLAMVFFFLSLAPNLAERHEWVNKIYNPEYRVGYVFLANLISSSFTLLLLTPWIIKIKPVFDLDMWKKMLTYSFPLLLAGVSGSLNDVLDKIILRRLIGDDGGLETVGIYGAAYKIAVLMALFIQMFRFAAEPFFFERSSKSDAKETYAAVMKYFVIVMLILWVFINSYLSGIQFIVGSIYREAMQVVPIISMGYLLYGIYINHSIWYKLTDMTIFAVYITAIGAVITVLVNILLVPVFGYMASAWAHVASYGAMILFSFWFAEKRYKIDYNMSGLLPYFLIAIAFVLAGRLIHYNNIKTELVVNSIMLISFILFAQKRDNIVGVFLKRT